MDYAYAELVVSIISLLFVFVGGCFALLQWRKSLIYKRTETVKALIDDLRKDKSISTILDVIDWNEGFFYNGKFVIRRESARPELQALSDEEFFVMIDHTLAVFSYICYLKAVGSIRSRDMCFCEYKLRRLLDNPHIVNYLYSIYHWSQRLGVRSSFFYLIRYALKKGYIDKNFKHYDPERCYLQI